MVNIMISPGAGKTTLLEKTMDMTKSRLSVGVIEGDLATAQDAAMIQKAVRCFDLDSLDLLIVENVGNLVCPAEFNLGKDVRVTLLSTAEGNDKISKYPLIFRKSDLLLLNKTDLLPYTDFSVEKFYRDVGQINSRFTVMEISARTGQGIEEWCKWLENKSRLKG